MRSGPGETWAGLVLHFARGQILAGEKANNPKKKPRCFVHQLSWGACAQQLAHHQTQVEAAHMSQLPLEYVLSTSQMAASHATRFVAVGEAAFNQFPAPLQQVLAVVALHPPPVCVDPLVLLGLTLPAALALLPLLWNVAAKPVALDPLENRAAQIALVRNQFLC